MDCDAVVVGGGVVGCAVALELARRGAGVVLVEAEAELGLGASGTNSGILHTGFDSKPGALETELILRAAGRRDAVLDALGVPVLRCGAVLRAADAAEAETVRALVANAERNGVETHLRDDGVLEVPGEAVTDPVAYTLALAAAAEAAGAEVRPGWPVEAAAPAGEGVRVSGAGAEPLTARVLVNCAGLHADAVARLAGDESFAIYPRKGEFFVFDPPDGRPLERILLPVPDARTKGVLVFPTLDGKVVAGPTAVDGDDKGDWSVRPGAGREVVGKAARLLPALEGAEPVASYAGLRPAGRGVNYLIGPSRAAPWLVNVAAIRSTGLTASLGIAEHVAGLVAGLGLALGDPAPLRRGEIVGPAERPWWRRTAEHRDANSDRAGHAAPREAPA